MVWVVNCYTVAAVAQASCVLKLRRPVPATGRVVGLCCRKFTNLWQTKWLLNRHRHPRLEHSSKDPER